MQLNNTELKNRVYKLTNNRAPLSFVLRSKSSRRNPLLHFDGQINRPLRYAVNQKSPFEDEQDNNAIVEPIIFENGFLTVPYTNPVLQHFLALHPHNGSKFVEVDNEKDAVEELEQINYEVDALIAAKQMSIAELERSARVVIGSNANKMTTAELRRDMLVFARKNPQGFLSLINDPMMDLKAKVAMMFDEGALTYRAGKDVHFNLPENKKRILVVPFGEDRDYVVASYFQSDEGIETLKVLERYMEND